LFHALLALAVLTGAVRLAVDRTWRRRLEDVAAPSSRADAEWLDAVSRAIDNDHEIIGGYVANALELRATDPVEAARRLGLAREQVEFCAAPDFGETLAVVRRLLRDAPVASEPRPWPASSACARGVTLLRWLARLGSALALTSKDRARVRLWLVTSTFRLEARAFVELACGAVDGAFEAQRAPALARAAEALRQAQLDLVRVAEDALLVRARRDRWARDSG
jgi:hypothetical protein